MARRRRCLPVRHPPPSPALFTPALDVRYRWWRTPLGRLWLADRSTRAAQHKCPTNRGRTETTSQNQPSRRKSACSIRRRQRALLTTARSCSAHLRGGGLRPARFRPVDPRHNTTARESAPLPPSSPTGACVQARESSRGASFQSEQLVTARQNIELRTVQF